MIKRIWYGVVLVGLPWCLHGQEYLTRSIVHDCEKKVSAISKEAMDVLVTAQIAAHEGKLSLSLQTEVRRQITLLEHIREVLFCVLRRGDPDYYDAVCSSMTANFASLEYDPKKAYEALGLSVKEGKKFSAEFILSLIDDELGDMSTPLSRKKLLRQLRYVFANEYAKQEYDAYLQGKRAIEALRLSSGEEERIRELIEQVLDLKSAFHAVSAAHH